MKPLTTDQPPMQQQLAETTLDWLLGSQQHLLLDPTTKDLSGTPSTGTNSPPFSYMSSVRSFYSLRVTKNAYS
jgi:hypothetical protein